MKWIKEIWNFTHINALKKLNSYFSLTTTVSLSMLIVSFCLVSYLRQTDAQIRENFFHSIAVKAVTTIICLFLYHVLKRYIEKSIDKQASVFPPIFFYMENILSFILFPFFKNKAHQFT